MHALSCSLPRRDVVFTFSFERWANALRRGMFRPPDRLLTTLLHHEAVKGMLVADPFENALVNWLRPLLRRGREPTFTTRRPVTRLITPRRWRHRDPVALPALARTYARYEARLRSAARRLGLDRPAVITFHPLAAGFGSFEWAHSVTYYARDDWATHDDYRRLRTGFEAAYAAMRDKEVRVCAVSEPLLRRLAPTGPSALVPNGVDPDEWRARPPPPQWFAALPPPRLVYTGVLGWRLDREAVAEVASRYQHGSIVLAGPVTDKEYLAPIEGLANVHVLPTLDRPELVAVVSNADACMIFHRRLPLTEAMSPLKLYEYLAAGRPVVAPNLSPVAAVCARVVLVAEGQSYADAVHQALQLGPASDDERRSFCAANSWQTRHDKVLEVAFR